MFTLHCVGLAFICRNFVISRRYVKESNHMSKNSLLYNYILRCSHEYLHSFKANMMIMTVLIRLGILCRIRFASSVVQMLTTKQNNFPIA
jgi:hypothetical protein